MNSQRRLEKGILPILVFGFLLTILCLVSAAWIAFQAIQQAEAETAVLVERQQASTRLILEIQGEEASLSSLFYMLASSPRTDRAELRRRMDTIAADVNRTLQLARDRETAAQWNAVQSAVELFIAEARRCIEAPGELAASTRIYSLHESLVHALADLVAASSADAESVSRKQEGNRSSLRHALLLLSAGMLLSAICAGATVRIGVAVFNRSEWQAGELSRLSGHVLDTQEEIVRRFSHELHDELGQRLTAIEANLTAFTPSTTAESERLEDCQVLVKDTISTVREMSQLMRPSMLDDFGLAPSLQFMAESFSQRSSVVVKADVSWEERLAPAAETHLYRIAQEALTNVSRHSGATEVTLSLRRNGDAVELRVVDNGRGFNGTNGNSRRGFGLIGMRERMRSIGSDIVINSTPNGVEIRAEVPLARASQAAVDPSSAG